LAGGEHAGVHRGRERCGAGGRGQEPRRQERIGQSITPTSGRRVRTRVIAFPFPFFILTNSCYGRKYNLDLIFVFLNQALIISNYQMADCRGDSVGASSCHGSGSAKSHLRHTTLQNPTNIDPPFPSLF